MLFLHIGDDAAVVAGAILAIINLATGGQAPSTREFLDLARAERRLVKVADGSPRAAVITDDMVYLSSISATTLARRGRRQLPGSLERPLGRML